MESRLKCKIWNCKTLTRKQERKLSDIGFGNGFLGKIPKIKGEKVKIDK